MKRLRDKVHANSNSDKPQYKRPLASSSRGESNGVVDTRVSGGVAASTRKLTSSDAMAFIKEVKDKFRDQTEKFDEFCETLKDFKNGRLNTSDVVVSVKGMLRGHPDLILRFGVFLPKDYKITLLADEDEESQKMTDDFEEALSFLNKIKERFRNDYHVYKSFLSILNMYMKGRMGLTRVYHEVAALFDDHRDLLDEFVEFLPATSLTAVAPPVTSLRRSIP